MQSFKEVFREIINLIIATRGNLPGLFYKSGGVHVKEVSREGILGGDLFQIETFEENIKYEEARVLVKFDCGHITEANNIFGECESCGGIICNQNNCMSYDPISQINVCQKCYSLELGGIPISIYTKETNLLWKWELKRYLRNIERKKLTE